MPSKMYENIDNELLDRLRPLELKDIDLNLIVLRKIESNPCPAQFSCASILLAGWRAARM